MRRASAPVVLLLLFVVACAQEPKGPPDREWFANAVVAGAEQQTDADLGAAQGVSLIDGKLYLYGDAHAAKPRCGIVKEYGLDLKATGRTLWLKRKGEPLLLHPTGLTKHPELGVFFGDTVNKKARIYLLDWERAWKDGNLDAAVIAEIDDDAAQNGCRPCMVQVGGKALLATADHFSPDDAELRLYDPHQLVAKKKSSAPGVIVHRLWCGSFNQNLHWDEQSGKLTFIQNFIEGRGWQLEEVDLAKAVAAGMTARQGVITRRLLFMPHDELEGYLPLPDGRALFVTSSGKNNITVGKIEAVAPRVSLSGNLKP